MILANFDLSFFTSIPGLLITGGVLLLLIALIIFIATGNKKDKKDSKNKKDEKGEDVVNTPSPVDAGVVNTVSVTPNVANEEIMPQSVINPVNNVNVDSVTTNSLVSNNENSDANLTDAAPNVSMVEPKVETQGEAVANNFETPTVSMTDLEAPSIKEVPTVMSSSDVDSIPKVETSNDNVSTNVTVANAEPITIVDSTPVVDSKPIYGGVSSVIPKISVAGEEHRPIYGGADPLENTGTIPTINKEVEMPSVTPIVPKEEDKVQDQTVEPVSVNVPKVEVQTIQSENVQPSNQEVVIPNVSNNVVETVTTKKEEEIESLF